MHLRTKALVLRETSYKESDKILTLLTQEQGKLTASARGCRKKGSPLAAGSQLLVWSDMILYQYQGRWTVKEAAVEREFRGVREDLEKLSLGCYFGEVTGQLAVEGLPSPEQLSLILNSLYALEKLDRPLALVKAAFELKAMCLAGYEPCAGSSPRSPASTCGRACSTAPPAAAGWGTGCPCLWTRPHWRPWSTSPRGTPSGCFPSVWGRKVSSGWVSSPRPIS